MTEFLKQWLLGLCMTALFCAVIFALVPKSSMKKSMSLACTAAITAAIFLPFANSSVNLNLDDSIEDADFNKLQSDAAYNLSAALSDEITEKIDILLTKNGYKDSEINILTGQEDSGLITVKRVDIRLADSKKVDELTQTKLYELLGDNVIIIFS